MAAAAYAAATGASAFGQTLLLPQSLVQAPMANSWEPLMQTRTAVQAQPLGGQRQVESYSPPVLGTGAVQTVSQPTPSSYSSVPTSLPLGQAPAPLAPRPTLQPLPAAPSSVLAPTTALPSQAPAVQAPRGQTPMLSEQMESEMAALKDMTTTHKALGRSPQDVSQNIQVVSLGHSCGVKMTIRRLGLDEATMPFDWIRTTTAGLLQWLSTDFSDYFRAPFKRYELNFRNLDMTVYRCSTHSFWHDNIEDLDQRQKLWRRVQRFLDLANDPGHSPARPLLFVRACVSSAEFADAEALHEQLQRHFEKYGRKVWLLFVVEDQDINGPILHASNERLLHWVQPCVQGPLELAGTNPGPYEEAISWAVRRMLQDPQGLMPGGKAGNGNWAQVQCSADIMRPGSEMRNRGLKDVEAGLWCGMVQHKNATDKTMFCAFEGFSEREKAYSNCTFR